MHMSRASNLNLYSTALKGGDQGVIIMTPHSSLIASHCTIGPSAHDGIRINSSGVGIRVYIEDSYIHRNSSAGIHILPDFNTQAAPKEGDGKSMPMIALSNCDLRGNGRSILLDESMPRDLYASMICARYCSGDDVALNDLKFTRNWPKITPLGSGPMVHSSDPVDLTEENPASL